MGEIILLTVREVEFAQGSADFTAGEFQLFLKRKILNVVTGELKTNFYLPLGTEERPGPKVKTFLSAPADHCKQNCRELPH